MSETFENQTLQHLLSHISIIRKKYDEIAEITGENFNVFRVLGLTSNEVRTHSAFIAELLNPKGSHGCKDAFLKIFVEKILEIEFNTPTAQAEIEKHIGFIPTDYSDGGFIDILVTDDLNRKIIIENKINAGDQPKQMYRYNKYGEKYSKSFNLIYLTLDGKKPSDDSLNGITNYRCISYEKHILEWLEQCLKEAVNKPLIRETITQYINLIKQLTNQTINKDMEKDIINEIIDSHEKLKSAFEIIDASTKIKYAILNKYKVEVIRGLGETWIQRNSESIFGNKGSFITFHKEGWNIEIFLYFLYELSSLSIGLSPIDEHLISDDFKLQAIPILEKLDIGKSLNYSNWIWLSEFKAWRIPWSEVSEKKFTNETIKIINDIESELGKKELL